MSIAFWICCSLMLFGLYLIFRNCHETGTKSETLGFLICVFTFVFGFAMWCAIVPYKTISDELITPEIAQSETTMFIKVDDKTLETKEHEYFNIDKSNIKIRRIVIENTYGFEDKQHSLVITNTINKDK